MDTHLQDMFAQARAVVDEENRRIQEEEQRKRDAERKVLVDDLTARLDGAFDFTSREKLDLDPRPDVLDGRGVLEFIVRGVRAIFILSQAPTGQWGLQVAEDDQPLQLLVEVEGGRRDDNYSRRLAAARIVTAIGDWAAAKEASAAAAAPAPATAAPVAAAAPAPAPANIKRPMPVAPGIAARIGAGKTPPPPPPPPPAEGAPKKNNPVPQFGKVFGY